MCSEETGCWSIETDKMWKLLDIIVGNLSDVCSGTSVTILFFPYHTLPPHITVSIAKLSYLQCTDTTQHGSTAELLTLPIAHSEAQHSQSVQCSADRYFVLRFGDTCCCSAVALLPAGGRLCILLKDLLILVGCAMKNTYFRQTQSDTRTRIICIDSIS